MSQFEAKKLDLNNINSKQRYENGDGLQAETINAVVEGVAYVQDALENQGGGGTPTDVQINGVSITKNGVANLTKDNSGGLVKDCIVNNSETLTDDEKTSACDWLGVIKRIPNNTTMNRVYVEQHSNNGLISWVIQAGGTTANTIALRGSDGNFDVRTPSQSSSNRCANVTFVTNLPDYVTLSTEQKAKWKTWIEGMGISGGSGSQLYLHQVTIHGNEYTDADIPAFDLVVDIISSKNSAYTNNDLAFVLANWYKLSSVSFSNTTNTTYLGSFLPTMFFISEGVYTLEVFIIINQANTPPNDRLIVNGSSDWVSITNDNFNAL